MANADVKLRVHTDTRDAQRGLDEINQGLESTEEKAKRVREAVDSAGGGGGAGGGGASGGGVPAIANPQDARDVAEEMADEFAKRAGKALGGFVLSYMADQGLTTAFQLARRPGEDSRRIDQAEATVQGALRWGAAGNAVAGPMGALVGSLLGGLNSFVLKEKEIRDAMKHSQMNYARERREAGVSSAVRQEEAGFDWILNHLTPQYQAERLRGRTAELAGSGQSGIEYVEEYKRLTDELARERLMQSASQRELGVSINDGRIKELEQQVKERRDILEKVAAGELTDADGNALMLGGNKAGTRNWYEAGRFYAELEYGENDEKRTRVMQERLSAVNALIDPLKEKELGVYLGEFDRLLGFASRSAITDSESSKGLGVGAQIGAMGNDKIISKFDELIKAMRTTNKDLVEVLRPYFQGGGAIVF